MGKFLLPLGTGIQNLGLAVIIGGILVVGAFTAPVIFKHFPRHEAGEALTVIFRRFDIVLLVSLGLVVLGEILRIAFGHFSLTAPVSIARYAILAVTAGMLLYSTLSVNAEIERMQQAGIHPGATGEGLRFARTHKLSENLYKASVLGAALLVVLTPFVPASQP